MYVTAEQIIYIVFGVAILALVIVLGAAVVSANTNDYYFTDSDHTCVVIEHIKYCQVGE